MIGRKVRTPWMTPQRFTPMIQFQSSSVFAQVGPHAPATPALLQTTCTAPNASNVFCASFSISSGFDTSVLDAQHVHALLPELRLGQPQGVLLDVGENDLHAFGGEALGEGAADAAGGAGDDGYSITKLLHSISS